MLQFNLLRSQGGNSREMTTSPPGHYGEFTVALITAAKLQEVRANSREMASQKLNEEHEILRHFRPGRHSQGRYLRAVHSSGQVQAMRGAAKEPEPSR